VSHLCIAACRYRYASGENTWEPAANVGGAAIREFEEAEAARAEAGMKCAVCSLGGDVEGNDILLCDGAGCGGAFHLRCLPVPLAAVPEGEWFCSTCESSRLLERGASQGARCAVGLDVRTSPFSRKARVVVQLAVVAATPLVVTTVAAAAATSKPGGRVCGTPGCTLRNSHLGPHTSEAPSPVAASEGPAGRPRRASAARARVTTRAWLLAFLLPLRPLAESFSSLTHGACGAAGAE
jgi:hypothetical protein